MINGKSVSLQKLAQKIESLEERVKKMEKERGIGFVRLSDREMEEIDRIHKEMMAGKEKSFREVFRK